MASISIGAKDPSEIEAFKTMMTPFDESFRGCYPLFSVAIKCRPQSDDEKQSLTPDLDEVAVKMYCKQFQFSSIEEDNLANAVFDMGSDYEEIICIGKDKKTGEDIMQAIRPHEKSRAEYIKKTQEFLDACYKNQSSISEGWKKYAETLDMLFEVVPNKWGFRASNGQWCMPFCLQQCLDQPFPPNTTYTYRRKMRILLEQAEQEMDNAGATRLFARIMDELNRNIGNRSKITVALEELEKLKRKEEPIFQEGSPKKAEESKSGLEDPIKEFRQLMNDRYNKALAYQHGCRFLDMCDYIGMDAGKGTASIPLMTLTIPEELIAPLAEMSWADFKKWLDEHKTNLEAAFNHWMSAYMGYTANDPSSVEESLKQYLAVLKKAILEVPPTGTHMELGKPWDEFGITDETIRSVLADTYDHPYYFVGGGSFEASVPGNEICILCVDEDAPDGKGLMIFRLRLGNDDANDSALDTLLAPVCNPLNGGDLSPVA